MLWFSDGLAKTLYYMCCSLRTCTFNILCDTAKLTIYTAPTFTVFINYVFIDSLLSLRENEATDDSTSIGTPEEVRAN